MIDRRVGFLAQVLDPRLLRARMALGRLDKIHEVDDVRLEPSLDPRFSDLPVGAEAAMA